MKQQEKRPTPTADEIDRALARVYALLIRAGEERQEREREQR
jgi:hypothetical protein